MFKECFLTCLMCIRERLRALCVHSGSGAQYLPVPVRLEVHYCDFAASCRAVASSDNKAAPAIERRRGRKSANWRAGSHYPTHADSMSKFLSSRSARLFLCVQKKLNIN